MVIRRLLTVCARLFFSGEAYARYIGVKVGRRTIISTKNFSSEPYLVTLGDDVRVTSNVSFHTHGASRVLRKKHPEFDFFGKIKIGNNVYIGQSAILLAGVEVGDNVVIGAGSVVTKSIPSNSVAAGNPARVICSMSDFENKHLAFNIKSKGLSYSKKKKLLCELPDHKFIRK